MKKYPCRTLGRKAPLQAFPKAKHSGRNYSIEQEKLLLDVKRIYAFLAKGKWCRKVGANRGVKLGRKHYYVKNAEPGSSLTITFCNRRKLLFFHNVNELEVTRLPLKGLSIKELMEGDTKAFKKMYKRLLLSTNFPL